MSKPPRPEELDVVTDEYMRWASESIGDNRRLSICRALSRIYVSAEDEDTRRLLRYASTLARHYILKLREYDREWTDGLCPRYREYDKVMRKEKDKE
jgi:hypothetical protein